MINVCATNKEKIPIIIYVADNVVVRKPNVFKLFDYCQAKHPTGSSLTQHIGDSSYKKCEQWLPHSVLIRSNVGC